MSRISPFKRGGTLLRNPHFWVAAFISLALLIVYQAWPWRPWDVWPWFPWLNYLDSLAIAELMLRSVGILFLIPIIYAAVVFSWPGALAAFLLALTAVLPITNQIWSVRTLVNNMLVLLLPVLIVSVVAIERTWRRRERQAIAEREKERQLYLAKILESQENERRRIAQELHDDTIQTLLVMANRAHQLINFTDGNTAKMKSDAESIRDISLQSVESVRRIILDLRPSILDELGLIPALKWLVTRMNEESGIDISFSVSGEERKLNTQTEVNIFRIAQEALSNIKRHSQATEAAIKLEFSDQSLRLTIEDNGQGFHPPRRLHKLMTSGKLGLIGIRERVNYLGGDLKIRVRPTGGTSLTVEAKL